jgi:hypothetical protein
LAITHPTAVRNALADYVVDQLDIGGPGKVVLQTSGGVTVSTLTFANPAFGAASAGVANANAIVDDPAAVGGVVTKAELRQGGGTAIVLCSVTATGGGGDIQLNNTTVAAGQVVSITSLSYTAPA